MTEDKWLTSMAVLKMTLFVASREGVNRRKAGRRKLRLLGCFSCRQLWEQMTDARSRHAVETAERLVDDQTTPKEVRSAETEAREAWVATCRRASIGRGEYIRAMNARGWLENDEIVASSAALTLFASQWRAFSGRNRFYQRVTSTGLAQTLLVARRRVQADAVRCIFGNPFQPFEVDPDWLAWNNGTLRQIARSIYDDRAWDQMPILGDALEDAGCRREDVLEHCRMPGPHGRGCHVVDSLLGKE